MNVGPLALPFDEVAVLVVFLAGDAAKNLTAGIVPLDGGWTAA